MNETDEQRARELLHDAVADVEPASGLDTIRARTAAPRRSPWVWPVVGAAAAAAVVVGVVLAATPGEGPRPAPAPAAHRTPTHGPATHAPSADDVLVPVYLVGDTGHGPRLFREFHHAPRSRALDVAADDAVAGRASDPDYHSAWPSGTTVRRAQLSHGTLSVDLTGPVRDRPDGMDEATVRLALQQLVQTLQGVAQTRTPVTFLVDGAPAPTVLGVDTAQPVPAATGVDVLAQVQVDDPLDGASLGPSFTVRGRASAFEATVVWELVRDGVVVRRGSAMAHECCTLSPYSFRLRQVPPGDYVLVVHDEDPSGGEGGPPWQDTKRITVE